MRELAVNWWVYGMAVIVAVIPMFFARRWSQFAASGAVLLLSLWYAHSLAAYAEDIYCPTQVPILFLGYGLLFVGGSTGALLWSLLRAGRIGRTRSGRPPGQLSATLAQRTAGAILGALLVALATVALAWHLSWRSGDMLADAPPSGNDDLEELVPATTEFDTHGENWDERTLTSEPVRITGTVIGWAHDRSYAPQIILEVTAFDGSGVSVGDRIGITVDDAEEAGLGDATKGSLVTLSAVFYDDPTILKAIPVGGTRYDASELDVARFVSLYSEPLYIWDARAATTLTGTNSWPVVEDFSGHAILYFILHEKDGEATMVAIPLEPAETRVHYWDGRVELATDSGELWNTLYTYADEGLDVERPIMAALNANGECVELWLPEDPLGSP